MNQTKPRVVITGFGALTAIGNTAEESWQNICQGKSGIAPIQQWDAREFEYPLGGELKDYNPRKMIADRKLLKLLSRQDVIGLNAVTQALEHSQLLAYRETLADATEFNDRTGVFVGSPGNRFQQQYDFLPLFTHAKGDIKEFNTALFEHIHPMWLLRILPNNVLAYAGILNGFKGANENITNHAISGSQAIAEAYRWISGGDIDRAVVVAYEAGVEPEGQIYYGGLGALSANDLKPFAKDRNGTILAEGAGALILETLESAKNRGATIYGEILGDATTSEAMGVFPIRNDADGLIRALKNALKHARISIDDIGMITAHGNGNIQSDATEALAIDNIFNGHAVPVTAFKWALGHSLSAAGTIEAIFSLLALREQQAPGIANLDQVANDCQAISVSQKTQKLISPIGVMITRAFASINNCLIINANVDI